VTLSITPAGRAAIAGPAERLRSVFDEIVARCDDPDAVYAALAQREPALDEWWEARRASEVGSQ
jgi:hypothetical protein